MTKRFRLSWLVVILAATHLFAAEPKSPDWEGSITAKDLRPHVEFLASPKLAGRAGENATLASEYVQRHFERLQLKPLFPKGKFGQPVPSSNEEGSPGGDNDQPAARIVGHNIGAWIEGSDPKLRDELIVLGAHFDHLGTRNGKAFLGADDNASGTAMLLEDARQLSTSKQRPKRSVVFIGFDLEEQMLWGSRWFVAHAPWPLDRVKLFLTADMIGRSLGDLPLPTVFVMGSEHAPELKRVLDGVGSPRGLEVARLGIDLVGVRSDYGPFWNEKIPFLFFSTGQHPDYHSPRDTIERLDFDKAARVSSLMRNVVESAANLPTAPVWVENVTPDFDEVHAVHRITGLLLEAGGKRPLTDLQQLLVSQTHAKCQQLLDKREFTETDRKWLIRSSQLLLLSVF